jgi:hypothetical protein
VIKTRLLFAIVACSLASGVLAQMQPSRFASVYLETLVQPKQEIIDSAGHTYKLGRFNFGMTLPLVNARFAPEHDTLQPGRLGITLHPSITYSRLRLSYFPQERILVNPQITLSTYYFFKQKNAITLNLRAMYNEDEFTIGSPRLRYNVSGIYARSVSNRFSYYAGGGYTYLFGEGVWLPILGARFSWNKTSRLNIILPLQISYRTAFLPKTRLLLYMHPQGGVNRFENRLNVNDTLEKTLVFRRRSLNVGAAIIWQVKSNVSVVFDPSLLLAQRILFTSDDETNATTYIDQRLERSIQFRIKLVWKLWQNSLRNQKAADQESADDDNFLLRF